MSREEGKNQIAEALARAQAEGRGQVNPAHARMAALDRKRQEQIAKMAKMIFIMMNPGEHLNFQFMNTPKIVTPRDAATQHMPIGILSIVKPMTSSNIGIGIDVRGEMGIDPNTGDDIDDPEDGPEDPEDPGGEDPESDPEEPKAGKLIQIAQP